MEARRCAACDAPADEHGREPLGKVQAARARFGRAHRGARKVALERVEDFDAGEDRARGLWRRRPLAGPCRRPRVSGVDDGVLPSDVGEVLKLRELLHLPRVTCADARARFAVPTDEILDKD